MIYRSALRGAKIGNIHKAEDLVTSLGVNELSEPSIVCFFIDWPLYHQYCGIDFFVTCYIADEILKLVTIAVEL